jgi:ADP-ribose pyrophosphatase YjhB (NUDIX family)
MSEHLPPSFSARTPKGEDRPRRVCDHCGFVDYENPKIVVGAVAAWSPGGRPFGPDADPFEAVRFLLCRRAILPRRGYWTLPAGYMETGETLAEATLREAREEALTELELDGVLAVYDIPARSQVQVMHRARLPGPESGPAFGAGHETLDAKLFAWDHIPWKALAFHSVSWALMAFRESREQAAFPPFRNPPETGWLLPAGV